MNQSICKCKQKCCSVCSFFHSFLIRCQNLGSSRDQTSKQRILFNEYYHDFFSIHKQRKILGKNGENKINCLVVRCISLLILLNIGNKNYNLKWTVPVHQGYLQLCNKNCHRHSIVRRPFHCHPFHTF